MCGAEITADVGLCAECGEQFRERVHPAIEQPGTLLERRLSNLGVSFIFVGYLGWIVSVGLMVLDSTVIGLVVLLVASAWMIAGYACAYKKQWGILTGAIVSYLALGGSLLYWTLPGIAVSLILSLQAHRLLRLSHQVDAAGLPAEEEF